MEFLDERSKREEDFVSRAADPQSNSRLACQSLILEGTGEIIATIPDQSNLPDEYF
jgi:ferredoxin